MRKIQIGIDIGTQFSYAGACVLTLESGKQTAKFVPLVNREYSACGMPSAVAYDFNHKVTDTGILYGKDAEDNVEQHPDTVALSRISIKQAIRVTEEIVDNNAGQGTGQRKIPFGHCQGSASQIQEIATDVCFSGLVNYFAGKIKVEMGNNGYKMTEVDCIVFTYPDPVYDSKYRRNLEKLIKKAFTNREIGCKSSIKVKAKSEAEIGGELIAKVMGEEDCREDFISVDVGAGTVDVAYLKYNRGKGCYYLLRHTSMSFGEFAGGTSGFAGNAVDWFIRKRVEEEGASVGNEYYRSDARITWKQELYDLNVERSSKITCHSDPAIMKKTRLMLSEQEKEWKKDIVDLIKKIAGNDYNLKAVLIGGSCHLPFIKDAIVEAKNNNDKQIINKEKIIYLCEEGNATHHKITDANFMAYGSAIFERAVLSKDGLDPVNTKKYSENQFKIVIGAPFRMAIKCKNGEKEGYYIVANIEPFEGTKYYLSDLFKSDTDSFTLGSRDGIFYKLIEKQSCNGVPTKEFFALNDAEMCFNIEPLANGEEKNYIAYEKPIKTKKRRGETKETADDKGRGDYYIGTAFHYNDYYQNNARVAMNVYIFPATRRVSEGQADNLDKKRCYHGKKDPDGKNMSYKKFKNLVKGELPIPFWEKLKDVLETIGGGILWLLLYLLLGAVLGVMIYGLIYSIFNGGVAWLISKIVIYVLSGFLLGGGAILICCNGENWISANKIRKPILIALISCIFISVVCGLIYCIVDYVMYAPQMPENLEELSYSDRQYWGDVMSEWVGNVKCWIPMFVEIGLGLVWLVVYFYKEIFSFISGIPGFICFLVAKLPKIICHAVFVFFSKIIPNALKKFFSLFKRNKDTPRRESRRKRKEYIIEDRDR